MLVFQVLIQCLTFAEKEDFSDGYSDALLFTSFCLDEPHEGSQVEFEWLSESVIARPSSP